MAGGAAQRLDTHQLSDTHQLRDVAYPEGDITLTGIIGATSFVGNSLLTKLAEQGRPVVALTRKHPPISTPLVNWVNIEQLSLLSTPIKHWILLAPIWAMPAYFPLMERLGAQSVVSLSSTSVITKRNSKDIVEHTTIARMLDAEKALEVWASSAGIRWAVLRPTLIYGHGKDKNLSEIARIIRKTRLFPLLGAAAGQRQPVHVDDVAYACLAALARPASSQSIYTLSGAEILPYHEMVRRVFLALALKPLFVHIPATVFEWAVKALQLIPRYRSWTPSMAERMNLDMAFSHEDAARDFGFNPRGFNLSRDDLP